MADQTTLSAWDAAATLATTSRMKSVAVGDRLAVATMLCGYTGEHSHANQNIPLLLFRKRRRAAWTRRWPDRRLRCVRLAYNNPNREHDSTFSHGLVKK
jgi:hypothetical protein